MADRATLGRGVGAGLVITALMVTVVSGCNRFRSAAGKTSAGATGAFVGQH